jgi:hypothetical protein
MVKTKDGHEALRWCGHQPKVSEFVFFTGCQVEALTPGGGLTIFKPGGGGWSLRVGQWLVKKGNGKFEVVDEDQIDLAQAQS